MNYMKMNMLKYLVLFCGLLFSFSCTNKQQSHAENLQQQYADGLKIIYDKDNASSPEAQLHYFQTTMVQEANSEDKMMMAKLMQGFTYIKLGHEDSAISILQPLSDQAKLINQPAFSTEVLKNLALAYLRLGERTNCIMGHSEGSCIFPIKDSGVYRETAPTEKGIKLYEDLLKMNAEDVESRWLLNIAYMTIGEYPGKVPSSYLIPGLDTDTSSYKVKPFQDIAGNLKLNATRNMAGGTIVDDFNNDGLLDIINSAWGLEESMHYYKNNGDNTFTDVSKLSGLDKIKGGLNIIQADYNNDGYTDILVLRGAWGGEFGKQPNTLLKNMGNGTFKDVTIESGILSFHPTQTATWADFNNDGWLDLFIGNETSSPDHPHASELYLSNKDGTFTNVANEAKCAGLGYVKGVTSGDYNNDGYPDIFISGLDDLKFLLKNKGLKSRVPQFENATHEAGFDKDTTNTFPTWFWDYDNDGWQDIFVCGYLFNGSLAKIAGAEALHKPLDNVSKMYLYKNNHDGTFSNVSKDVGLDHTVMAMGSNFGDVDNDGWLDMYLGTGNPDYRSLVPNKMFKNIDGKKFADVTGSARVGNLQKGHAVAFADIDNDGDEDIFTETGGAYVGDGYFNSFYLNPGRTQIING